MQIRQFDTVAGALHYAGRCSYEARQARLVGDFTLSMTLEVCVLALNRQIDRMENNVSLAAYEFRCWSGVASGESNAERAALQTQRAWTRLNSQAARKQRGFASLIGTRATISIARHMQVSGRIHRESNNA